MADKKVQGKPWWKSKTKLGAVLIGGSAVLGTVGGLVTGSIDIGSALQALIAEVGIVMAAFGVRDWPVLNKK